MMNWILTISRPVISAFIQMCFLRIHSIHNKFPQRELFKIVKYY